MKEKLHVLGAGAIGLFFAHHFEKKFPGSVQLIRRNIPNQSKTMSLIYKNETTNVQSKINLNQEIIGTCHDPISNVLVCTKSYDVVNVLNVVKPRLLNNSNVILISNGLLSVYEKVESLFPIRPNIILGTTTIGVIRVNENSILHTGQGDSFFGPTKSSKIPRDLSFALSNAWGSIGCQIISETDILRRLAIKMAVNAAINPTAGIINCENGYLLIDDFLINSILKEISPVIGIEFRELFIETTRVARMTAANRNSMLNDISKKQRTEIDDITGYFIAKGKKMGYDMPVNETLFNLVKLAESIAAQSPLKK